MIKMIILLAITSIGISVLGYLAMVRLDNFIETGGFIEGPEALMQQVILIYSPAQHRSDLEKRLSHHHIRFQSIPEPHVPENMIPWVVAALSDSDMDNLLLCNEARHLHPDLFTVAVCNDTMHSRLFKESGINCVFLNDFSEDKFLEWLHDKQAVTLPDN